MSDDVKIHIHVRGEETIISLQDLTILIKIFNFVVQKA